MKMHCLVDHRQARNSGQVVLSSSRPSLSAVNLELESLELFTMECGKGKIMPRLAATLIRNNSLVLVRDHFKHVLEMIKASKFVSDDDNKGPHCFLVLDHKDCALLQR